MRTQTEKSPVIVEQAGYPTPLEVVGMKIPVLADGPHKITIQAGPEGSGPPPHSHPWDETFFVLKGAVEFTAAGRTAKVGSGALVQVPARTPHAFRFAPGGGEMLEMTGGASDALGLFSQFAREMPPGPPDIEKVRAIMAAHEVTLHL